MHKMDMWIISVLGLYVLIGLVTCQNANQNRAGVVFSLGNYPNFLATVVGKPADLEGENIHFNKYLKFNDSTTKAISLAVDTQNQSLYYFDSHLNSIIRINNFNLDLDVSKVTHDVISDGISGSAVQIAFDWISHNIYWTDDYNNWIAVHPVFTRDNTMRRNIIETMLITPQALAIDPESGYLFFSDLRPTPRIEVCNLLGEKRRALVASGLSSPSYIVVDHAGGKIFWADSMSGTLESILYNGLNRTLHSAGLAYSLSSFIYFKDHICASFKFMYMVGCINVNNFNTELYGFVKHEPVTATVFDPDIQMTSITNRCNLKKCQHFCINTPTMARCVCKEGYQLTKDGVNCTAGHILSKKGILFTNGSNICVLDIRAINTNTTKPNCVVNKLDNIHYLQADSNKGIVYYWNKTTRSVQKYDLITGRQHNVTFTNDVKGLFFDWVNEGLYWSDIDHYSNRIRLLDLVTRSESKYQYKEVTKSFEYLTGNPYDNLLFWVLKENMYSYEIEMGTIKGSNRTTIVDSSSVTKPTGLAYDSVYNRLYWIDSGQMTSVKITTDIKRTEIKYHDYVPRSANTLYLYKDYALWIYNNDIKAVVVEDKGKYIYQSTVLAVTNGSHVTSMTYFDQRTQTKTRAPCEGDNGGCQFICIPTSEGPTCSCPFGYKENKDGKTCGTVLYTDDFALIVDYNGRMYQMPLNKTVTAADIMAVNITNKKFGLISDLTYDATNKFVYWLVDGIELCRSKLNGQNFTIITRNSEGYIESLAIDETTGNVYILVFAHYGYQTTGYIAVLRQMEGREWRQKTILKGSKDYMLIHSKKGYIFWVDSYQNLLGRMNMDGTGSVILKKTTDEIWRFYIDFTDDRIYWSDYHNGNIYSMNIDGNDVRTFITMKDGVNNIAFWDSSIFVILYSGRKIYRYDKTSKKEVEWMQNITYIQGIESMIVSGNKQPENAACKENNGYCSTFCLPTSSGRTCACEDGVKLRSDKKTCENMCESVLPNGQITDCAINAGAECSYTCNVLYEKNKSIGKIRCLRNMTWDQKLDGLCKEKTCTMDIPNVDFLNHCDGKLGSICFFMCKKGYIKDNYSLPTISCSGKSGNVQWNTDLNKLCKKAVYCPSQVPHGRLFNCPAPTVGTSCGIVCTPDYSSLPSNPFRLITCGSDGNWNEDLEKLCIRQRKCPSGSENVQISNDCPRTLFSNCSYTCKNGKIPALPHVKQVACLMGNSWVPPLNILCKDHGGTISVTEPSRQRQRSTTNTAGAIGGVLGAIVVILIAVVVVGIICFMRRTRAMREYKEEPNVFFRNPSVTENPYNQFSNVDCRQVTATQFSNPMSNVDSIYDNIPDGRGAEGFSTASQQSMKAVEEKTMDTSYNMEVADNKVNTELKKDASMA